MKKKKKKIGILGGIGPEATGEFYLALILKFQEKDLIKSNKDFPQIIINSIPAPELLSENISEKDLRPYIKGLKELEKFGVDFIAMLCNTVHLFHKKFQKEIKVPIVDLRKEVKNYLFDKKIKSATVLGSPNVIKKGLYKFGNVKYVNLSNEEIKILNKAVFDFNRGFDKIKQGKIVGNIAKKCIKRGADLIILGCTEVAIMLKDENIPKIDPMDLLIDIIVKHATN